MRAHLSNSHLSNSMYGVLDYVAQPAAMLLAAPILLHRLGVASYGVWLIASAAVGAGSIVSSGFGDAVIQRVATLRASGDVRSIRLVVANLLSINLILSGALAILLWAAVPFVTGRVTHFDSSLRESCVWSLRIGALLMMLKSIESVFVCAQRAFERYGPAVRIAIVTRLLTTLAAVALAVRGYGVPALMLATAGLTALAAAVQGAALREHLGSDSGSGLFKPAFDRATLVELGSFGGFTWLQAVSGVVFSQADRLLLGTFLGASSVSYYGICVQMAQPIHGLTAAGLHFLFPHLALRFASGKLAALRRPIFSAMAVNAVLATAFTAGLMLFGPRLLGLWMGNSFAAHADGLLAVLAAGFGLLALNVTGHYALLALGKVRLVTVSNVAGGVAMLVAMAAWVPGHGVSGAAWARLCYGPITCLIYVPLLRSLRKAPASLARLESTAQEGV
jgi:O-antigen/teichoic acid export membrane protein